jgi:hypothetical protein
VPSYCYICDKCGHKWSEFRAVGNHPTRCPECDATDVGRDYQDEFSGSSFTDDWSEGGYNIGISYKYKSKSDLLREIRKRGFEPSRYDNGLKPVKRELYGDNRRFDEQQKQVESKNIIVED